jgi:hypothetical protein
MKRGLKFGQTEGKITHFIAGVGTEEQFLVLENTLKKRTGYQDLGNDTYGSVFKNTMRLEF